MWRIDRKETKFSDARFVAWNFVLPFMYIPILSSDEDSVEKLTAWLKTVFSTDALKVARKNLEEKIWEYK